MGLFDQLKNTISGNKQEAPAPAPIHRPSQETVVKGSAAPAPASDTIRVKFGSKMPYYDPDYGQLELSFNGFGEVRSENWAKDPKASDFISQIIVNSITKGIMEAGKQSVSHKDLPRESQKIRQQAIEALEAKNMEVRTLALNTITLTAESRELVKQKDEQSK